MKRKWKGIRSSRGQEVPVGWWGCGRRFPDRRHVCSQPNSLAAGGASAQSSTQHGCPECTRLGGQLACSRDSPSTSINRQLAWPYPQQKESAQQSHAPGWTARGWGTAPGPGGRPCGSRAAAGSLGAGGGRNARPGERPVECKTLCCRQTATGRCACASCRNAAGSSGHSCTHPWALSSKAIK